MTTQHRTEPEADPAETLAAGVRRTGARLADGRTLHYYDDSPGYADGSRVRDLVDARDLRRSTAARRCASTC